MARDGKEQEQKPTRMKIDFRAGGSVDAFPEAVTVQDSNDCESLPDTSGIVGRRGSSIVSSYAPTTDPPGRIALVANSDVPNLSDGSELMVAVDTSDGNAIRAMCVFKTRSNLAGDVYHADVRFARAKFHTYYGSPCKIVVKRTGALDRACTVDYTTADETATAGADYTTASGTLSFGKNEVSKSFTCNTTDASQASVKTVKLILSNPNGGAVIIAPNPATLVISPPDLPMIAWIQ